jgi:DsbC/DsbD-like thiol-disulfide interchange protein
MAWLRGFWICLCAVALAHSTVAQNYQGKELVHATVLVDTWAIVPGKPFAAGVLLRMAPGWHTYWKFSGDAGLPT